MSKSMLVTTRVEPSVKKKLEAIAKSTRRSESLLAKEAIEAYVEVNDWQVALIEERLEASRRGAPSVPFEDVKAWMESLGTDRPLPKPRPRHDR